jgi:glyoxylase-like metal-dependent hydrolase (beta-lactamase superfamily II)
VRLSIFLHLSHFLVPHMSSLKAHVECFFDHNASNTSTFLVVCPETNHCVIIDPVLDFDYPSCTFEPKQANQILARIQEKGYVLDYIFETHAHADHVTSSQYLKEKTGAKVRIIIYLFHHLFRISNV